MAQGGREIPNSETVKSMVPQSILDEARKAQR